MNEEASPSEIIRCKDCKWFRKDFGWNGIEYTVCELSPTYYPIRREEDFCSRAERRKDGTEDTNQRESCIRESNSNDVCLLLECPYAVKPPKCPYKKKGWYK